MPTGRRCGDPQADVLARLLQGDGSIEHLPFPFDRNPRKRHLADRPASVACIAADDVVWRNERPAVRTAA